MTVLRPRIWRFAALAGLTVVPLLVLAKTSFGPGQGVRFSDVQELKVWAENHGLYCRSDRRDGKVSSGLAISTRPLTWKQVGGLCRARPGQRVEWEGIIWAINRPASADGISASPWQSECRVWGGILVTGDRHMLDRIEGEGN
jgi:hypothetical protein